MLFFKRAHVLYYEAESEAASVHREENELRHPKPPHGGSAKRFSGKAEMAAEPTAAAKQGQLWLEPATPLASLHPASLYPPPPPPTHDHKVHPTPTRTHNYVARARFAAGADCSSTAAAAAVAVASRRALRCRFRLLGGPFF